ncbi:hypothetical protein [Agriterribacter sp.]|uniref:hypothetical protein n=1 Tax=Agriterribacter sp. TaxID=2821509 RepID=UPI002BF4C973|nr:hypothetical protein [Agriterribacter sp.]HRO45837.1 hypothetical protein [Agriterribacter sp.]HRQ16221.1 hypothetical protein [Agriterribacter sp.]
MSCKKDKNDGNNEEDDDANLPPLTTVIGYWVGKYGAGANEPNFDYAFMLKADSTMTVYMNSADTANAEKAYGVWEYNNNMLKTYYAFSQQERYSTISTLKHRTLTGTWGPLLETVGGGKLKVRFK